MSTCTPGPVPRYLVPGCDDENSCQSWYCAIASFFVVLIIMSVILFGCFRIMTRQEHKATNTKVD